MNHLLSDSPWNYQDVLADLCIKTSEVLSGTGQEVGLLIDEVGFRKKGRHSACVGRQYLGCIGKHDNGQVAVVAGLSSGKYYCPIDVALFMPKSWQDDHIRRKKAKIPENIQHQSKPDMAGAMIASMRKMAINFDYVAFDALYGNSFDLLSALHAENILFVGDVRDNVKISVEPITYSLPEKPPHSKGRKFKHKRVGIILKQHTNELWVSYNYIVPMVLKGLIKHVKERCLLAHVRIKESATY
jgi:SRSO17 transposase